MIEFDSSHFPLVFVRASGEISLDDAQAYVHWHNEHRRRALELEVPLVQLADGQHAKKLRAPARACFAEYTRQIRADDDGQSVTVAIVQRPFLRGLLTAISWVAKWTPDVAVAKDIGAAVDAVITECRRRGVSPPVSELASMTAEHFADVRPAV